MTLLERLVYHYAFEEYESVFGVVQGNTIIIIRHGERVPRGKVIAGTNSSQRVCILRNVLNAQCTKWLV